MVSNKINVKLDVPVNIVVNATVTVKKSSDLRKVQRKAVAGLSDAELIERNSVGTYEEEDTEQTDKEEDQLRRY